MTTRRIRGARKEAGWISGVRLEPEPAPAVRWRPIARTRAGFRFDVGHRASASADRRDDVSLGRAGQAGPGMRPPQDDRKAWFVWGGSSVLDGRQTRRLVSPIGALRLAQRMASEPLLHARERRGPGEDQREPRRRGADLDHAEGEARPAEEDRDRVRGFPLSRLGEILCGDGRFDAYSRSVQTRTRHMGTGR